MVRGITDGVRKLSQTVKSNEAKTLAEACLQSLAERFRNIEANYTFSIASYLDPRFKRKAFINPDSVKVCRDRIVRQMERIILDEDPKEPTVSKPLVQKKNNKKSHLIWESFDESVKDFTSNTTEHSSAIIELRSYTDEQMIPRKHDPLEFWKKREPSYPRLSKLAKKYLMIPATSVPCERVFSKAGELVSDRRNRLSPKHVEQLLFLNANVDL